MADTQHDTFWDKVKEIGGEFVAPERSSGELGAEFPKMLYSPNGDTHIAYSELEEAAAVAKGFVSRLLGSPEPKPEAGSDAQ